MARCLLKQPPVWILSILCLRALLASGCSSPATPAQPPAATLQQSPGAPLSAQGEAAFAANDFDRAADFFLLAQENDTAAGGTNR